MDNFISANMFLVQLNFQLIYFSPAQTSQIIVIIRYITLMEKKSMLNCMMYSDPGKVFKSWVLSIIIQQGAA